MNQKLKSSTMYEIFQLEVQIEELFTYFSLVKDLFSYNIFFIFIFSIVMYKYTEYYYYSVGNAISNMSCITLNVVDYSTNLDAYFKRKQ